MQWRKFARLKTTATGHSRTRRMLCCGRRKENGRSVPDLTASPGRAPPGPMPSHQGQGMQQQQQHHPHQQGQRGYGGGGGAGSGSGANKEPVLLQGDFRKVSGISSEIFRQIEAVENDHDPSTAAALEAVERRGEMIVRILEPRCMGSRQAVEAGQKFLNKADARHTVQLVEIVKRPGQTLGLYIREGNGADRSDGVFISRIALESAVYNSGCLRVGDEILAVNLVDVTRMSLDDVVIIMSIPRRLVLAIRQRRGSRGANSPGPPQMARPEQKPPPVVVIKRDLRDDDLDDSDRAPRSSRSSRERRTGDGREMTESRSRLGLGLNNYSPQSEQLDLYYGSRPGPPVETPNWGYKPPPPPSVITEQPKGTHGFQTSHSYYQNAGTLESLAEKVHSFYPGGNRRMSAGTGVSMSQSHQRFPRSGSDQHLPRVEYADYASLGRHTLLRSSLKSDLVQAAPIAGGTLGRYGRYEPPPSSRTPKYAPSALGAATGSLQRRSRPALDYSSDTEATIGPRPSYYYYNHPAMANTIARGSTQALGGGPEYAKFNSLPRERPGSRMGLRSRIGERIQDENDGNLSAPEYSLPIRRDPRDLRQRITASPSIFTSDEYRAWLRRAPSSSAICEQMRASRDILNQQRAHRFSCSAENIHDVLKNTENIYSSRTGLTGGTLDRYSLSAGGPRMSSLPVRSMSSQHIGPSSIRSPSVRRMRQLLELTQGGPGGGVPGSAVAALTGHQSPAPTPSTTLPRAHRQIDINPAEYTKYKLDKPVVDAIGMSGMLWIHLLAGRGLRAMSETAQPQQPMIRDLYCVLECDRIHKARTVVRSGDLQFDWDESFELDLVCNKQLDVLVYSWDPQHRHKLCYRGALSLTTLLRQSPIHQLALKVEPRGTIYLRLRHTDPFQLYRRRGLPSLRGNVPALFGADLETVVTREAKGAPGSAPVPIILRRCVEEVERRGLDIIGLYRLCGSATKKRLLREAFERNSRAVELTPDHVPDINVITGVLKDYLRELPEPLFTKCLFQMTVDALGVCLPDDPEGNAKLMLSILDCLPRANRATLVFLLDHLSLVVSAAERNKMSAQALATVMGPPLMLHSSSAGSNEEIDHAQPIAVLKYLLQIWPQPQQSSAGPVVGTSGRRGEPVEPRGNKASALQVGKSQTPLQSLPSASSLHQQQQLLQQQQQHQAAQQASSSLSVGTGAISRSVASSPSTTSSQLGPHPLSATPSNLQYQSVVAQLAQSHRVSQQVGQQPHPLEGSAASAAHVQSPHHATPSPSSSSTSSASGSGSGTDTIKRGASPASVKFKESSSSYSLKSDTSRILSSSSSLAKKYATNGSDPVANGSAPLDHQHHLALSSSSSSLLLGNGAGSNGGPTNGTRKREGNGATHGISSTSSSINNNNGPNISSSSDLQLPSRSVLFSSDYLSSTSTTSQQQQQQQQQQQPHAVSIASHGKVSTTSSPSKSSAAIAGTLPISSLDVATFSLDEKNNLVVSPSPSESSHHSSNSSLRERSPQKSPSLKRQEPIDRTGESASSGSSFISTLRSQTLGSYQFPSSSLKLPGQLSADSSTSADDGSTSSLLRKLTSSLSRTITSNTGTLPLSLGRQQSASSSLYQQDMGYSSGSSGKPTSSYASSGGSMLGEGNNGGNGAVTTAAAVSSMSIYGTLPKNSSIYSYGGTSTGLLTGTSSSYGISDRLRALTGTGGGGGIGDSGMMGTSASSRTDSGAGSSDADLGASGYDYESSGFSSTGLTSSYGTSASMTTSATSGGLSSSYFSTGSGTSPFSMGGNGTSGEGNGSNGHPMYRVQYSSTNPFLPSYNPPSDNGGTGNGAASGRNGGLKSSDEDDSFDMK
ncbi:rho GTPase-activating protein 100F isoform X2 [Toxorhynchites rutilus septentrionalis]|uniref:rho GTPase-activating protein 100F isoform X2 n=1 Tax=Toxorhynchites rutilus septentrionalis TaxID=329112 RepID=UPI002479166F|nr:rho GTPase-activating protein 100F isoform X2 [Toxorhynchites rutilus septentrionalis]